VDAPAGALRCRTALATTLIAALDQARGGAVLLDQAADKAPNHVAHRAAGAAVTDDAASAACVAAPARSVPPKAPRQRVCYRGRSPAW
jgi:hypothetical protein